MQRLLSVLCLLTSLTLSLALPIQSYASEYAQAWQQPLNLEFAPPARQAVLSHIIDPQQWITTHQLDAQVLPFGRHQHLVQFTMEESAWQNSGLCDDPGVSQCESVACQSVQVSGSVSGPASRTDQQKARIVKRAPAELAPALEEAGSCSAPVGLVAPQPASAGGGANINLNLGQLTGQDEAPADSRSTADSRTIDANAVGTRTDRGTNAPNDNAESANPELPSTATANEHDADPSASDTQATTGVAALRVPRANIIDQFDGTAQLMTADLPADSSEYELLVGQQCDEISIPLDSVSPAHEPHRINALVDAGSAAGIALSYGLQVVEEYNLAAGETLAVFTTAAPLPQALALLMTDPRVSAAQREYIYRTTSSNRYSDPFARFVYGPDKLGAVALHTSADGQGQTVAVIDTGVMLDHPELQGRIQHADMTGSGFGNGAHGTAVAGIIAAAANNALGIYGVAPQTQILALKACQPAAEGAMAAKCRTSSLVKALDWAMQQDARLINMSLAGPPDALLAKYVALAVSQDRLIIAGAGNSGPHAKPAFPAALPGVLAVTAIDQMDRHYAMANTGGYIDVAGPGVDIVTPSPNGNYPVSSGTSWAAAHITGVAALLKDLLPLASAAEISAIITTATRDLGAPGKDDQFGHGLVDACLAASTATADPDICPPPVQEDSRAFN